MLSRFSRVQLFATPWTAAPQAHLSMEFSRQEYWSGLPCPPPGYLLTQRLNLESLTSPALTVRFFSASTPWKALTKLDSILKSRDITLPTKVHIVKAMVFPVVLYGCKCWTIMKIKHFQSIDAFELWCWKRLLDRKEIKPVNPKGNQPWVFIGRAHDEVEAPILWAPDAKSWLIGKDPDAGKEWRWKEKVAVEDEMIQ